VLASPSAGDACPMLAAAMRQPTTVPLNQVVNLLFEE
jgi:hypothetical protein